jgi:hypothetical protein
MPAPVRYRSTAAVYDAGGADSDITWVRGKEQCSEPVDRCREERGGRTFPMIP